MRAYPREIGADLFDVGVMDSSFQTTLSFSGLNGSPALRSLDRIPSIVVDSYGRVATII